MTLGENLQGLRRAKGLSQDEVAQKLFVSRQTISKWELDKAEPGVENLKALADLYGVTVDQLVGCQRTAEPPEEGPEGHYQKMLVLRTGAVLLFLLCWVAIKALSISPLLEEFF